MGSSGKIRIATAAELFEVLNEGPMEAQVGVLRSILQDPKRPLSLGKHEGEDIVDLLLRLISRSSGGLKRLQLTCLSCYRDPRTTDFLAQEFSRTEDAAAVLHLGRRLAMEKSADFFREFLWTDKAAQALAASRVLTENEELSPRERLRVAIISDQPYDPPPMSPDTLDLWIAELNGHFRRRTRELAEKQSERVLYLWERWSELAGEEKEWLLKLTAKLNPSLARQRLGSLLKEQNVELALVQQALALEMDLPPELLQSKYDRVRAVAVAQGLAGNRTEEYLSKNSSLFEAVAAVAWCKTETLLELLADPRWQVRAAATNALAVGDEPPISALRRKATSGFLGEKVAAIEVLRRVGDDEWLTLQVEKRRDG